MQPFLSVRLARRGAVLAVVAAVILLTTATTAFAAPPSPTLSTAAIQSMLEAGPVTGHFETVLGGATIDTQTPTSIPVTIKAILPGANPTGTGGDLILFECDASGPIVTIGGIAHGMSGSPLYIDVGGGGSDLAGAVSYGDIFTTHYLGEATPIDDMIAIQTTYMTPPPTLAARPSATTVKLATPVKTASAGAVSDVTTAPSATAAARLSRAAAGPVMAPLTTVQIGGLDRRSAIFKKLAASLTARGLDISPFSAGTRLGYPAPPAPDSGGDSLGAMYATGDVTIGAFGTITYVDPEADILVAFGHPFDWIGPDSLFLTSAWVQGVWSTNYDPYKVMSPGANAGEITQDRSTGVAGTIGATPAAVPVTSHATMGSASVDQTSAVTSFIVQSPLYAGLPSAVAGAAMFKAADAFMVPGSATTEVKIDVSDGTNTYHVDRTNVWSDIYDVTSWATGDIDGALSALVPAPAGVSATVKSISFTADLSRTQKTATIEDVSCPGGLKTGSNTVSVSLETADGSTVHVPVTLDLPSGYPRSGTLEVFSATSGASGGGSFGTAAGGLGKHSALGEGQSLGDLVDAINAEPTNSDLEVTFTPFADWAGMMDTITDTHDWVVDGDVAKDTGQLSVQAPSKVAKGKRFTISGMVVSADGDASLTLYKRPAGASDYTRVGAVKATATGDGSAAFSRTVAGIKKNTSFKLVWNGDGSHLGATWTKLIKVK